MHARLGRIYTGKLLTDRSDHYDEIIRGQQTGDVRVLGGGTDYVHIKGIVFTGDSAAVAVEARIWSRIAQDQGNGRLVPAEPHNTMLFEFQVVKVGGAWLVSSEKAHFAPGSEP
jgi:hypothetical protein